MLTSQAYVVLVAAVLLGALATWVNRALALRLGLVSHPNAIVPQHTSPVAHLGGIGIGLTAGGILAVLELMGVNQGAATVAVSGLGFLILGSVDDLHPLAPLTKFVFQALMAGLAAGLGVVYPWTGQHPLDLFLSVAWIVTLVNAVNVTDVCDGFVGGIAAILFLFWGHLDSSHALIAMAVSGACFGFLVFNFPPASIFLGDAGSHLLGFSLAYLMLAAPAGPDPEPWRRPVQMVLVSGVFFFEVALLIVVRRRKGIPWYKGSPDHIALRMQAAGLSRRQTDAVGWSAAALLCATASLLDQAARSVQFVLLAGVATAAVVCWKRIQRAEVAPQRTRSGERTCSCRSRRP